jgi:hypothetical protein
MMILASELEANSLQKQAKESKRIPHGFWGRWIWNFLDALLVIALLNCAYLLLQYGIHVFETARLQAKSEYSRARFTELYERTNRLVNEIVPLARKDPKLADILSANGVDLSRWPQKDSEPK